jgi:hypothetical protein
MVMELWFLPVPKIPPDIPTRARNGKRGALIADRI